VGAGPGLRWLTVSEAFAVADRSLARALEALALHLDDPTRAGPTG